MNDHSSISNAPHASNGAAANVAQAPSPLTVAAQETARRVRQLPALRLPHVKWPAGSPHPAFASLTSAFSPCGGRRRQALSRPVCTAAVQALRRFLLFGLGVALLLFTLEQHVTGYTFFTCANGQPEQWPLQVTQSGPIAWDIVANAPDFTLDSALYCTQSWAAATDYALQFQRGANGILVDWDSNGSKIVDDLFLAFTTVTLDAAGHITGAHVVVNGYDYVYHRGAPRGVTFTNSKPLVDLDGVLLHEFGHTLGMGHSDLDPAAIVGDIGLTGLPTMNSVIYAGAETLHPDDLAGIRVLYPNARPLSAPDLAISGSPLSGPRPLTVFLTQTGGNSTVTWDFGDGTHGTGATATHKYQARGAYVVTAAYGGRTATLNVQVGVKAKPKPRLPPKQRAQREDVRALAPRMESEDW